MGVNDGKRGHVRAQLNKYLESRAMKDPVYGTEVEHYMGLYDKWKDLDEMAKKFCGKPDYEKLYLAISSEMRQVEKSMQGILDFLDYTPKNIQPKEENIDL